MTEKFWAIRKCDLFSKLTETECQRIEQIAKMKTWAKDSPIYLPSDAANCIFLLSSGRVKISSITPDGKQAIVGFIEAGDLFGELAAFGSSIREEMATAVVKSTVVLVPKENFTSLMESSPRFTLSLSKLMGLRRSKVERRLRSLLFRSSRDRLIQLLLDLHDEASERSNGSDTIIRLSHNDLASLIGSTRETVTATLGELQTSGLVELKRQKIALIDRVKLAELAQIETSLPSESPRNRNDSISKPSNSVTSPLSNQPQFPNTGNG